MTPAGFSAILPRHGAALRRVPQTLSNREVCGTRDGVGARSDEVGHGRGANVAAKRARLGRALEPLQNLAFEKLRMGEISVGYVHDPVPAGGEALVSGALVIELGPG